MDLPMAVPHPVVLRGTRVTLEPFELEHTADLLAVARSAPEEFALTSTPITDEDAEEYFATALNHRASGFAYPFTVRLTDSGEIIGMSRLNDLNFTHRNSQLGYSWFHPSQYGSASNVESKLLMLTLAFEELRLHRVSLRTDVRNTRSRQAILALGATEEGILRRHMVTRDGHVRDSALYAITDLDWPAAKARIEERVARRLARSS